ncbi:cupin [Roseomonas sp. GC11]|uniref:cupin n=1 Tax=Roseomonas sp. GC11 TaxID=2950546 RepID=UPI00210E2884|nr:cupin [Roseomonas sp. GC11]MCQ4158450.1 cupin [Roseomonas sp. GC11]
MTRETIWLQGEAGVPNNPRLPVLLYRAAFAAGRPEAVEGLFARHGWPPVWRDGIHPYVHFHTTAHEALGIAAGAVQLRLGGEAGPEFALRGGDVVVLPAGTGHQCLEASADLLVVGAYPLGQVPDQRRASPGQAAEVRARVARLPDPPGSPVTGEPYPRRP